MRNIKHQFGLTLIELMVAMVITTVLGVLSYRGISSIITAREIIVSNLQRWNEVQGFIYLLENNISQIAFHPQNNTTTPDQFLDSNEDGNPIISFIMLDGTKGNVRRVSFTLENNTIMLYRWYGSVASGKPRKDKLLDHVHALNFEVLNNTNTRFSKWPPAGAGKNYPAPEALQMKLELDDIGTINRLFVLY